ncbi:hypothetical protein ACTXT7_011818 [Hymenolepis weldensis]
MSVCGRCVFVCHHFLPPLLITLNPFLVNDGVHTLYLNTQESNRTDGTHLMTWRVNSTQVAVPQRKLIMWSKTESLNTTLRIQMYSPID